MTADTPLARSITNCAKSLRDLDVHPYLINLYASRLRLLAQEAEVQEKGWEATATGDR